MKRLTLQLAALLIAAMTVFSASHLSVNAQVPQKLYDEMIQCFQTGESLDISQYSLGKEELEQAYCHLIFSGKLPWYAAQKFTYKLQKETNHVVAFIPEILDPEQYSRNLYEQAVSEILADTVHEGMEPWEKALSVHDYLIAHSAYDEQHTYRYGYDLLVHGTGVCSSYAYAYMDLMNRIGIPCQVVESKTMGMGTGHAWNLIQLDGSWYHVDLTWDDPLPNVQGRVNHKYFLLTDEEMSSESEEPHFGWETDIVCDGPRKTGIWKDSNAQIIFPDGDTCIYRSNENWNLYLRSISSQGNIQTLHTETANYFDIGNGPRTYGHNSLSYWNNRLYFSTVDALYSMNPDGTGLQREYAHDIPGTGQFILGSFVTENQIFLTLADCQHNITSQQIPLEPTDHHVHTYAKVVVAPTCLEDGYTRYTCQCGISYMGDPVPATGHQYARTVLKKPSLFHEGLQEMKCTRCGDSYREAIPAYPVSEFLKKHPGTMVIAITILIVVSFLISFQVYRKKK